VGNTIEFSVCNKHFKPLGLPNKQVKSREGSPEMLASNIMQDDAFPKIEVSQKQCFLFINKLNKMNTIFKTFKNSKL
jgi:hypothetical protein